LLARPASTSISTNVAIDGGWAPTRAIRSGRTRIRIAGRALGPLIAPLSVAAVCAVIFLNMLKKSGFDQSHAAVCRRSLLFQPIGPSEAARIDGYW
jgi:hypothetical protein